MNKEQIVSLMTKTFQEGNRTLCKQFGMSDADIAEKVDQAEPTIGFLLETVYEELSKNDLIKSLNS
jgi:hypothetical protein